MAEEVYRAVLALPVLIRASSAEAARKRLEGISIDDLVYEVNEGSEMIAGTRTVPTVEHVPASDVERELLAVGNDGTFFDDPFGDEEEQDMGDGHGEGEGKD